MTYESNPFSSYLIFNKLSTSPKWFFIFRNEKKNKKKHLFLHHMSPLQQPYHFHFLIVMRLISIYVLTLIQS